MTRPAQYNATTLNHNLVSSRFTAEGLLILMTSSSVATGLAHLKLIIRTEQILTRRAVLCHVVIHSK